MDSSEDEDLQEFIKNLSSPIVSAEEFLKEQGIHWDSKKPSTSRAGPSLPTKVDDTSFDDYFESKLSDFQKCIFGGDGIKDIDEQRGEHLEKVIETLRKQLNEEPRPKIKNWRHLKPELTTYSLNKTENLPEREYSAEKNSLIQDFPLKGEEESEEDLQALEHLSGLKFICSNFEQFSLGPSGTWTLSERPSTELGEQKCYTTEETAEILVECGSSKYKAENEPCSASVASVQSEHASEITCEKSPGNENVSSVQESGGKSEGKAQTEKKATKKKKKEKKYEPKKVEVPWSDVRNDKEFAKELCEIMKCGSFPYSGETSVREPELDDMCPEPAALPRNLLEMLLSASDNDIEDWEYSITLQAGGETESEDSEMEDLVEKEKAEILAQMEKADEEEVDLTEMDMGDMSLETSDFLQEIMPLNVEELVGERNDSGQVISYRSATKAEEHIHKEFMWTYEKLDSDSDEEEEQDDDPEKKIEETEWEPENVKATTNTEEDEISEEELMKTLDDIEEFTKRMEKENEKSSNSQIPSKLQEQILWGNKLLDKLNVPKAGEIEEGSPEEIFTKELRKFEHIRHAHVNKMCPPGKLEEVISSEDEDDAHFRELSAKGIVGKEFETISRPAQLFLKFPEESGLVNEEKIEPPRKESGEDAAPDPPSPDKASSSKARPPLFDDDDELGKEDDKECREFHNIFEDSSSSSSYGSDSSSTDESIETSEESSEEEYFDNEFRKEYFRRGGTEKGLGELPPVSEERETLKSYTEKYFTFPFASQHSETFDFVRMRRVLAQCFPEFREEAFADLSRDIDVHLSEPEDSSSESEHNLSFIPEPFDFDEVLHNPTPQKSSYDDDLDLSIVGEDSESDFEPIVPSSRTYEDLVSESELNKKKKYRKKRREQKFALEGASGDADDEGVQRGVETPICGVWSPLNKVEQPTEQKIVDTMKIVHKFVVPSSRFVTKTEHKVAEAPPNFKPPKGMKPVENIILPPPNLVTLNGEHKVLLPPPKFRTPKGMKAWLRGEFTPSTEVLQKWKKQFLNFYGNHSMLERVITSEQRSEYELFLETVEDELKFDAGEFNLLKKYKKVLEDKKKAKEEKEKADEIILSGDAPVEEAPSAEVDQADAGGIEYTEKNPEANLDNQPVLGDNHPTETLISYKEQPPNRDILKHSVIRLRDTPNILKKEEWAEEVDCSAAVEFDFTPAMTFSFTLDGFQRQAIAALESGFNVFVSAHTSAGKTVVAEYAIAMSKRNRSKAVYTSPVKALSNQKYADFKRIFGSVGLITGDIQLNENAECLIMTTEILRSMLYNSSEKIRDLQFVVFDEVHYINDPERGHVWEEVLILLSSQVQIVMLSATVPNTLEFANWVGRTKQRKVIVCATHHRPVPLNHYLYTGTGGPSPGNTYLLKSGDGQFLLKNYLEAEGVMKTAQDRERQAKKKQHLKKMEEEREWKKKGQQGTPPTTFAEEAELISFKKDQTMWVSLISFLEKKDWLPAVSFVFSRKKCDCFAEMLTTVDLTTKSEKSFIHKFIKSQIEKLDEVDQDLPQIQIMKRQLDKGIGVHHSGILPVMKEIVEVLFQEGKVKLLFATETFAMGVNMPARTVIFHSIKKFDGNDTRLLLPAEYVQMAGRAGRRGKDAAGNVIILAKPTYIIPRNSLEILLFGNPCKLTSKFRLTYRMILNTLTVSGMLTVQNMMERSYCENQGQLKRVFLQKDLIEAEEKEKILKKSMSAKVTEMDVEVMSKFYDNARSYINKWNFFRVYFLANSKVLRDVNPGRLLKICMGSYVNRTTLLLETELHVEDPTRNVYKVLILDQTNEFERTIAPDGHEMDQSELELWYRMVSLMKGLPSELEVVSSPNDYTILSIKANNIVAVYKETVKLHRNQLDEYLTHLKRKAPGFRNKTCDAGDSIARLLYSHTGRGTEIDERQAANENFELALGASELWSLYDAVEASAISSGSPLVMEAFRRVFRWKQALSKVEDLRLSMSVENMTLYPDFISKLGLLKDKEYISSSEQVLMKGYMAARVGKYELIVCEMLVENVLVDLSPEEAAALLSFLVYQTSSDDVCVDKSLPVPLQAAIVKCKKIMIEVTNLEKSYGIRDFEGSEISKLKFGLVPVMYAWAKQEPLKNIMEMPVEFNFQEGMLVRWIQQLLETLKEVEAAARLMGDPGVPSKLQAAGTSIKRGIVFAPSLYTTML